MSVNPLSSAGTGAIPLQQTPTRSADRGVHVVRPDTPAAPARAAAAPANGRTLSADAPSGVDPQLWSVLTADERTHFARLSTLGPLTYGRGLTQSAAPQAPAMRGARLDIRI